MNRKIVELIGLDFVLEMVIVRSLNWFLSELGRILFTIFVWYLNWGLVVLNMGMVNWMMLCVVKFESIRMSIVVVPFFFLGWVVRDEVDLVVRGAQ